MALHDAGEGTVPQHHLVTISLEDGRELAREAAFGAPIGAAGTRVWIRDAEGGLSLRDAATLKVVADREAIIRRNPHMAKLMSARCTSCEGVRYHQATGGVCLPADPAGSQWFVITGNSLVAKPLDRASMPRECTRNSGLLSGGAWTAKVANRTIRLVGDDLVGDGRKKRLNVGPADNEVWFSSPAFLGNGTTATPAVFDRPPSVLVVHSDDARSIAGRWAKLSRVAVDDGRVLWEFADTEEISTARAIGDRLIVHCKQHLTGLDLATGRRLWVYRP